MRRLFYISFLLLPIPFDLLFSQINSGKLILDVSVLATRNASGGLSYDDIEGSPYYSNAFVNSTVHLKNGDSATLPLRYDLFQDEIEFMQDEKILWLIKQDISYICYGTEILFPESYSAGLDKITCFFSHGEGDYALYIRKKVSFHPYVPPQGYADPTPNRFERDSDGYYLKQKDKPVKEINSKKVLLKILSDNEPALNFIKENKTRVNKSDDLLELVKFLNNQ